MSMRVWRRETKQPSRGFTLLELLVVLVILAAVAALVLPTLGFVRDQARFTTAAAGAAQAMSNLELYKAATGNYPNQLDTMVNEAGTRYTKSYGGLSSMATIVGATTSTSPLGGFEYYYLSNGAGISKLMPHREDSGSTILDPNASSEVTNALSTSSAKFFVINPTPPASDNPYYAKWNRVVKTAYPNQVNVVDSTATTVTNTDGSTTTTTTTGAAGIPAGHALVVLGIGSRATCVGSTMTSAPIHDGVGTDKYARYYAFFDVQAGPTGRGKVQLKLVTDSEFETITKNISNYRSSGPTPSDSGGSSTSTSTTTLPEPEPEE